MSRLRLFCYRLFSEMIFLGLVALAASSTWYDCHCQCGQDAISAIINRWAHAEPALAFAGGIVAMWLLWLTCRAWGIKYRYGLALLILGFCLGHLFWCQAPCLP